MRALLLLFVALYPLTLFAAIEVRQFNDPALAERYTTLTNELRCLVCQNENLAASNAELAHDLRQEVFEMLEAGKTDKEIKGFMVQRYGDFVLYRPPLKRTTLLLWAGPFILLLFAILALLRFIRGRVRQTPVILSNEEHRKVQALLQKKEHE